MKNSTSPFSIMIAYIFNYMAAFQLLSNFVSFLVTLTELNSSCQKYIGHDEVYICMTLVSQAMSAGRASESKT